MPETFNPATWADGSGGGTPITAAQLNRIENGIESMDDRITAVADLPQAKGDVITATAAATLARLPVGANGQVLTANSATATGLSWAAGGGGGGGSTSEIRLSDYMNDTGTADTAGMQAAVNAAIAAGGGHIVGRPGGRYRVSGTVNIQGFIAIDLRQSQLSSSATGNATPIFKAHTTLSTELQLFNGYIIANCTVADMRLAGDATGGISGNYRDLYIEADRSSDTFLFTMNDFLLFERIRVFGGNRVFVVSSDFTATPAQRDNTQVSFRGIGIMGCNLGLYCQQVDKLTIDNFDVSGCGTGIHLARDNKRVHLRACHIEDFGNTAFTYAPAFGHGYVVGNDGSLQYDITFQSCSTLLPASGALSSYKVDDPTGANDLPVNVAFRECHAELANTITGYRPLRLGGQTTWEGRWAGFAANNVTLGDSTPQWADCVVRPQMAVTAASPNLLPFARISRPQDLTITGTLTVAADATTAMPHGRAITLGTASTGYASVALQVGWHTYIVNGYSPIDDAYLYVADSTGATTILGQRFRGFSVGQMFRLPFYIATAGTYRVGLASVSAGGTVYVGQIELHRGHVNDFTDDPTVSWGTALPTTGVYLRGDRVRNSTPSASGTSGWVCTTAPNTFKAEPNLSA